MFQIGVDWQIGDLPHIFSDEIPKIKLRGHLHDEPLLLPSEFTPLKKSLSVSDIASKICPTRRDLFLSKRKIKDNLTWGRIAGLLIENYCSSILKSYETLNSNPLDSYQSIQDFIKQYTAEFLSRHKKQIDKLKKYAAEPTDDIKKFMVNLEYTGRYELLMLGADRYFNRKMNPQQPLVNRVPLRCGEISFEPQANIIGITAPSTPDLLIESLNVVGDIKSGDAFKNYYPLTCAGYAIAYESARGVGNSMNFGVIYFLETHAKTLTPARSYYFLIDDELRQEFIDSRNEAYEIISAGEANMPKPPADNKSCQFCKYNSICTET